MNNPQEILHGPYGRLYERYGDPTPELHAAYDSWLADMAGRPGTKLQPFEFDLQKHPEQSVYIPKVDALPIFSRIPDRLYYNGLKLKMARSLGAVSTLKLLRQFDHQSTSTDDPTPLMERLRENQRDGRNTLVVTSHINFQEFGYVIGLRHIAKRDRADINKKGAVLNKLMTRQEYKGLPIVRHLQPGGNVLFTSPKSASADKHKVPENASNLTNALFRKVLKPDLKAGGQEIDIALTGSEVKQIRNEQDELAHYLIPQVDPASADLLKDFDDALAISLVGPPLAKSWQMAVSDLYDLKELLKTNSTADITDLVYGGIRQDLERFTQSEVIYNKVPRAMGRTALRS